MKSFPERSAPRARLPLTFLAGTLLAIAAHAGLAMTLDERIACREKIEDVYWAHRLWPKENQGQKPAREAVAPHATIAARVEDSLRYETAIGELWHEALSPRVIQAEMDREARATRDPAMLRELWAALGNEPARVAECLVRPELTERRIKERYADDPSRHWATRQRAAREIAESATLDDLRAGSGQLLEVDWQRAGAGEAGIPRPGVVELAPEEWRRALRSLRAALGLARAEVRGPGTPSEGPAEGELSGLPPRLDHTAVWTGTEMIVWGGRSGPFSYYGDGGRYDPSTDTWTATSGSSTPSPRAFHSAVWTGTQSPRVFSTAAAATLRHPTSGWRRARRARRPPAPITRPCGPAPR